MLSNLDAKLRYDMRNEFVAYSRSSITAIYVTHDQSVIARNNIIIDKGVFVDQVG